MSNKQELRSTAKTLGIKGYSKMAVASLEQAINSHQRQYVAKVEADAMADSIVEAAKFGAVPPKAEELSLVGWDNTLDVGTNCHLLRKTGLSWRQVAAMAFLAGEFDGTDDKGQWKFADKAAAAAKKAK